MTQQLVLTLGTVVGAAIAFAGYHLGYRAGSERRSDDTHRR